MKKKEIKKTKEIKEEKVMIPWNEMSDKEMESLFLDVANTSYWQAVLKFNRMQHENVMAVLSSVDMFKNPTQAARAQGTDIGLFTLEAKVNNLVEQNK